MAASGSYSIHYNWSILWFFFNNWCTILYCSLFSSEFLLATEIISHKIWLSVHRKPKKQLFCLFLFYFCFSLSFCPYIFCNLWDICVLLVAPFFLEFLLWVLNMGSIYKRVVVTFIGFCVSWLSLDIVSLT